MITNDYIATQRATLLQRVARAIVVLHGAIADKASAAAALQIAIADVVKAIRVYVAFRTEHDLADSREEAAALIKAHNLVIFARGVAAWRSAKEGER